MRRLSPNCADGMILVHRAEEIKDGSTVLIRTHGISPEIMRSLEDKKCDIIDCTCPFVNKIHDIVRKIPRRPTDPDRRDA